ncbi:hypothetical protein ACRB8A_12390 [Arthrobacter sp. G.S.26]|uniref:hypothetical protein n=1 Tax=Arthrobacter sp. G.S.26 TaxID=3433706 RepID=UPI003D77D250
MNSNTTPATIAELADQAAAQGKDPSEFLAELLTAGAYPAPETLTDDQVAALESRLRSQFKPPAGFRLSYSPLDINDQIGGMWDGPVFTGNQWKVTSHWGVDEGITFYVDGDRDNAIPATEAGKIAEALAQIFAMDQS